MTDKIWKKILGPEEKIEIEFTLGKRYLDAIQYGWFFFSLFCFLLSSFFLKNPYFIFQFLSKILFIATFFSLLNSFFLPWYLRRSNNVAFTTRKILIVRGWLSTKLISIDFDQITDIKVEQNFFEKIAFDTGNLIINTAGTPFPEVTIYHIEDPYKIKVKLDEIRKKIQ